MSFMRYKPEISEGDELQIWAGDISGKRPHDRLFDVKVLYAQVAPPLCDGRVQVILTCDVLSEFPPWIAARVREAEARAALPMPKKRWFRR